MPSPPSGVARQLVSRAGLPNLGVVGDDAILVHQRIAPPLAASLARALAVNHQRQFFKPCSASQDYDWYPRHTALQSVTPYVTLDGQRLQATPGNLRRLLGAPAGPAAATVGKIEFELVVRTATRTMETLVLPADLLMLADPASPRRGDRLWILAPPTGLEPETLTRLTAAAFFAYDRGASGAAETQRARFLRKTALASEIALGKPNALLADYVADDVRASLDWLAAGRPVTIRLDGPSILVDFPPPR